MNDPKKFKNDMRAEYYPEDFPDGFVRGKYVQRIKESSNVVVLKPEVAAVFKNEDEVNDALLSLIELAKKSTQRS